jgi:ribosomal protein L14
MAVLVSSEQVCLILDITANNLHQIVHRKQLAWVKKEGKKVFFESQDVVALKAKRDSRGK